MLGTNLVERILVSARGNDFWY